MKPFLTSNSIGKVTQGIRDRHAVTTNPRMPIDPDHNAPHIPLWEDVSNQGWIDSRYYPCIVGQGIP